MKRLTIALILAAMPLVAQQTKAPDAPKAVTVATVNGETITATKLNQMYSRLSTDMRAQYDKNGGKGALLENYIRKRLLIQEAMKKGYDKRPDVQADLEAAREAALFDRYVREVVAQSVVPEAMLRKYYEDHVDEFAVPETAKIRHIVIGVTSTGPRPHTQMQAFEIATKVLGELKAALTEVRGDDPIARLQASTIRFSNVARKHSEDPAGPSGGDLGWVEKGQLDPEFEASAFGLRVGVASGIVKTQFGYHIIFVEGKRAAGTMAFDEAKQRIRERLVGEHAAEIVAAVSRLTTELGNNSKVQVYPENIK